MCLGMWAGCPQLGGSAPQVLGDRALPTPFSTSIRGHPQTTTGAQDPFSRVTGVVEQLNQHAGQIVLLVSEIWGSFLTLENYPSPLA